MNEDGGMGGHGGEDTHGDATHPSAIAPDRDALLLDAMLGNLASYLRMCGYDAAYAPDRGVEDDTAIRSLAAAEGRRLITRDRSLAASTPGAVLLTERETTDQLRELHEAGVALEIEAQPSRCGACNGPVERVDVDEDENEERPEYAPDEGPIWRCLVCDQHFWTGSHWDDVAETLASL
ncbi:Mut7-C RNAse domain-containing protein [Halobaculum magnesiiphilum]|uniref:Mut7-C RNAse domain-containing protein n=1 Tax=Halobaculum magnesiiphilum TaxID=1017351 RepID=A0A8T8WA66_9EURY|nr:Mut7-C RNAse domain-containing protein [Halobaculum magnesiiphilum]QZP36752.1 Mut7-C RNAse domain-containing protein [Halobaculum magnesiiphilum]